MPGWRVKYNHFGAVGRKMKKNIADAVEEAGDAMALQLKSILWVDTRLVRRVTTSRPGKGVNSVQVAVGWKHEHGFYSRFQEWGTVKQAARPIVGPTAHRFEPKLANEMAQAVRSAANAK